MRCVQRHNLSANTPPARFNQNAGTCRNYLSQRLVAGMSERRRQLSIPRPPRQHSISARFFLMRSIKKYVLINGPIDEMRAKTQSVGQHAPARFNQNAGTCRNYLSQGHVRAKTPAVYSAAPPPTTLYLCKILFDAEHQKIRTHQWSPLMRSVQRHSLQTLARSVDTFFKDMPCSSSANRSVLDQLLDNFLHRFPMARQIQRILCFV